MRQITHQIIAGLSYFSIFLIPTHAGLPTEPSTDTELHSQIVDKSNREIIAKWRDRAEEKVVSLTATSSQELIQQINRYSYDLSHPNSTTPWTQTTDVYRLDNVSPDDWAFEVLQRFNQNYGCLSGYSDGTFRGSRTLTRYEFAAALETCWKQIENLIAQNHKISQDDLTILRRLIDDFEVELANLESQINRLEHQVALLESLQFSTTTKLNGQVVFGNNFGNFEGDRIIDPKGRELADSDPQATFLYRASLDFDTSFRGDDLLKVRVDTGSNGTLDNATGLLEPNFGSILDISNSPPRSAIKGVGRVYYQFQVRQNLSVTVGPLIEPMDFFDKNRYANLSFRDFSTENFVYNYVLFAISGIGAGGVVEWNPNGGALSLRTLYIAADAASASENEPGIVPGVAPYAQLLYSNGTGERGLFGDFYQTMLELEYAPSPNFTLRLLYSGGEIFDRQFDGVGVNFEWAILPQMGIFGRYGYSSYEETDFGDINPNYWMIGVSGLDLFKLGDRAGFATGQPFIASGIGNATQTNLELFYHYPINDNIQIAPIFQMILDSSNQNSNGTIFTGTFRTVFSF